MPKSCVFRLSCARRHHEYSVLAHHKQRPEGLAKITERVLKGHREIWRFKDAWPLERYIYIHLKNYDPKVKTQQKEHRTQQASSTRTHVSARRVRPGPGRQSAGFASTWWDARCDDMNGRLESATPVISSSNTPTGDGNNHSARATRRVSLSDGPRHPWARQEPTRRSPDGNSDRRPRLSPHIRRHGGARFLAEKLRVAKDLAPIQVRVLKEGLDRLHRDAQ
ncbi:hypothetical protein BV20DRAFT_820333 [Pilatotrama ljubarskyi]|nr:hypothetical protein BV20DRAFT_820333 [Pilatotrama ljubarskyi]